MKEQQNYKIAVSDFTAFLYQKGYRGKYTLHDPVTGHPRVTGTLSTCLDKFLSCYRLDNGKCKKFELRTQAPYNARISCSFKIELDEVKGFLVRELTIEDKVTLDQRYYMLGNNRQIPGANSIEGLFPKPKPWDDAARGKFRPKR